jgi:hypothetical protein
MTKMPAELPPEASALCEVERGGLAELWRWPRIIDALLEAVAPESDYSIGRTNCRNGEVSDARRRSP